MKKILTIILLFILVTASAQEPPAEGLSFESLEQVISEDNLRVYYHQGERYSGQTYDYYEQEQKIYSTILKDGLIQVQYGWDKDRKLIHHYQYEGGRLHGQVISFFSSGQPYFHHQYHHGLMHGQQYGWYANGQLRFDAWYEMGFKRYQKDYDRNGKLKDRLTSRGN